MYESVLEAAHRLRLFGIHSLIERRCVEALAKRLTTRAKFRSQCDLQNWDRTFDRGLSKQKMKAISLLNFYFKRQNLLILGSSGVGKTHLAIAHGRLICQEGSDVQFYSVSLLFEQNHAKRLTGTYLGFIE